MILVRRPGELSGTLPEPLLILILKLFRIELPALQGEQIAKRLDVGGVVKHADLGILETQVATLAKVPQFEQVGRRVGAVHDGDVRAGLGDPHNSIDADAGVALRFQMDEDPIVALELA